MKTLSITIQAEAWHALVDIAMEHLTDLAHRRGSLPRRLDLTVPLNLPGQVAEAARLGAWLRNQGIFCRIAQGRGSAIRLDLQFAEPERSFLP